MQTALRPVSLTSAARPRALAALHVGRSSAQARILCVQQQQRAGHNSPLACSYSAAASAPAAAAAAAAAPAPSSIATPFLDAVQQQRSWLASAVAFVARSAFLLGLVLAVTFSTAGNAFAARSGGRVGGSSFGARSSFGGGSSGFSSGFSRSASVAPSRPTSSHTTIINTGPSWGMSSFFLPVTPFGYGYGSHSSGGGSIIVTMLLLGVLSFIAIQAFQMMGNSARSGSVDEDDEPQITVAKVQVGLLAVAKDIKADLNLLGATANTSTPEGLHLLLQETVVALLRNPAYCTYGTSSSKLVDDMRAAESAFNAMTMEERSKVDSETLVNVSGSRRTKSVAIRADSPAELIVVNLMVAAEGDLQLPTIRSLTDLRLAMSKLASVPAQDLMAVEVFWTPQADDDVLTQQDCMVMYPSLVPL